MLNKYNNLANRRITRVMTSTAYYLLIHEIVYITTVILIFMNIIIKLQIISIYIYIYNKV